MLLLHAHNARHLFHGQSSALLIPIVLIIPYHQIIKRVVGRPNLYVVQVCISGPALFPSPGLVVSRDSE
jgi:hypothetical protein